MKSVIKILNMYSKEDSRKINETIGQNEGVIASQISLKKKEVTIVYDELTIKVEKIVELIEDLGYMVN